MSSNFPELDSRTTFVRGVDRTGITTEQWIAECMGIDVIAELILFAEATERPLR